MPPSNPPTPSTSRPLSRSAAAGPAARVTRLRSAKEGTTGSPSIPQSTSGKSGGLLARSKEGLRLVSEKMKDREREREKEKEKKEDKDKDKVISRPKTKSVVSAPTTYSESLQAFLRIRPTPTDYEAGQSRPYLEMQGDQEVIMRAPADTHRPHMPKPPHVYSFDRVFGPDSSQSDFFTNTTLPLVDQLLRGENGLLFAYGVSNSGKTYSVSGGNTINSGDRGVLPRAIDVIFNSISGHESHVNLRCSGLGDVTLTDEPDPAVLEGFSPDFEGLSDESIKVDKNFSYAVLVSYAEVYNEKIFDLLDDVLPITPSGGKTPGGSALKRSSSHTALFSAYGSSMNLAAMVNGGGGVLKRRALALKNDPDGNGKYISGLSEIRVKTRQEALAVFRTGQRARQVFGTLANRESSRSHGIFTLKVVRIHNGAPEDPDSAQVSRLAIVDLAGSERTRNTQTTGDRLKEAGNINKSLMVLGQCLEVLRANQQKMASSTPVGSKKRLAMVPFRHSKLTEIFQNFFVGDGRAVMIVHVNPYDTGFDENSHVMRFSAIAREIQTTASNKVGFPLLKRQISTQFSALRQAVSGPMKVKVMVPVLSKQGQGMAVTDTPNRARLAVSKERESDGYVLVEEEIEVVEEDISEDSEEEDETDWMVEHLFDQLKEVKQRLYESEMRNATIEAEVREEAAQEMQEALKRMHSDFAKMFQDQVAASEMKTDRKLDILSRTIPTPAPARTAHAHVDTPGSVLSAVTDSEDMSMDQSFESAEQSMSMADIDMSFDRPATGGRLSDPFLVKPIQVKDTAGRHYTPSKHDADKDEDEESDTASESGDEEDEEAVIATLTPDVRYRSREDTVESEDPLAAMPAPSSSSLTSDEEEEEEEEEEFEDDDEEEEEVEEVEGEEDGDHAYTEEEDDEADEEDGADQESSFAASTSTDPDASGSDSEGESEDEDESKFRRGSSIRRRKTGSPIKKSQPALSSSGKKNTTTNSNSKSTPIRRPSNAKTIRPKVKNATTTPKSRNNRLSDGTTSTRPSDADSMILPLGERKAQDKMTDDADEEDEIVPTKPTPKKKRVLGKKVMTEDEMIALDAEGKVGPAGAEIRRMMRGSGQFSTPFGTPR